jgi:Brp/Blh family beta-carotene 15,15'-monooxygenase
MTKAIFIFIASVLLLLPFVHNSGNLDITIQLIICTPFLLLLGIPHGAIDNVLFLRNNNLKNSQFISIYLVFVALNVGLWFIAPSAAYILFLLVSAYHFGQSQFSHYFTKQPIIHKALYFFWGTTILLGLIYLNIAEILSITSSSREFAAFGPLHKENIMLNLFLGCLAVTVALMLYTTVKKSLQVQSFLMEVLVIALVLACFYLMPLLIGFTFYFIILHSFKVLKEEYHFLTVKKEVNSVSKFIQLVAPFTLLSIAGIAFLFALIYFDFLALSYGYCLLIVISSITLPHVVVMNRFYFRLFKEKSYQPFF